MPFFRYSWMTKIVLPLKDEFHGDKKTSLTARFHDVHPSLLLFLHRLRSITIQNDVRNNYDNGVVFTMIALIYSKGRLQKVSET